jgi:hypothetical protein
MKKILSAAVLFLLSMQLNAQTSRALFIGNSYTQYNNLPSLVANLAAADGINMVVDSYTPGGYTFQQHSTDPFAIAKINSQQWDFVILQEQSQRPSFSPAQVASQVYPYAAVLDSLILNNNPCSETVFYMTWGRKNGDASNCGNYPPICTYDGMQARLRESYMEMGMNNQATVSPVGAAWKLVRTWNPNFDLYVSDESHPSLHGSYLAACVHYATLFHKSPVGNSFISSLSQTDAALLQSAAHAVVIDSVFKWYEYGDIPLASFSYSSAGNNVQYQNHSLNSGNYAWSFGDGNTSVLTNPSHTYAVSGTYAVSLVVNNGCKADAIIQQITAGTTGVNESEGNCLLMINDKPVVIDLNCNDDAIVLSVYDLAGRKLVSDQKSNNHRWTIEGSLKGIYLLEFQSRNGRSFRKLNF